MREVLNQAQELNLEISAANHLRAEQTFRYASFAVLGGAVLAVLIGVVLWWRIGVRTSREVRQIAANLRGSSDQVVLTADSVSASRQLARAVGDRAGSDARGDLGLGRGRSARWRGRPPTTPTRPRR